MEAMARALAVSPLAAFSQPNRAQTKLRNMEPMKLPMYTMIQFRSIPAIVAFLSSTEIRIRVLPVNNSAPVRITVPRPKAKRMPEIIRTVELPTTV